MRGILILGGFVLGGLYYLYKTIKEREEEQRQQQYGHGSDMVDDFVFVPRVLRRRCKKPKPDDICSICQDRLLQIEGRRKYGLVSLPCAHWYHLDCAMRLVEYSDPHCPICRSPFDVSELRQTQFLEAGDVD